MFQGLFNDILGAQFKPYLLHALLFEKFRTQQN